MLKYRIYLCNIKFTVGEYVLFKISVPGQANRVNIKRNIEHGIYFIITCVNNKNKKVLYV